RPAVLRRDLALGRWPGPPARAPAGDADLLRPDPAGPRRVGPVAPLRTAAGPDLTRWPARRAHHVRTDDHGAVLLGAPPRRARAPRHRSEVPRRPADEQARVLAHPQPAAAAAEPGPHGVDDPGPQIGRAHVWTPVT